MFVRAGIKELGLPINICMASFFVMGCGWLRVWLSYSEKLSSFMIRTRLDSVMMAKYAVSHSRLSMYRSPFASSVPGSYFPHRFTLTALRFCGLLGLWGVYGAGMWVGYWGYCIIMLVVVLVIGFGLVGYLGLTVRN